MPNNLFSAKNYKLLKIGYLTITFSIGARYKGKLSIYEISVNGGFSKYPYRSIRKKTFSDLFWATKKLISAKEGLK
jgi:hypothetical protein